MWYQKTLTLSAKSRGFHLVTDEILNQLADMPRVNIGLLHLLLQHTSASLTLNENCDPTVRHDMERFFLRTVPDNGNYEHDYEGADDMPSHIKSSMLGTSLVLVHKGRIQTGTGIWLGNIARRIASHHRDTTRGVKNDHFGVATILHGKTSRTERA
ncbi:hypothetical protein BANRA_00004 [Escherichia coli]|nr:hypothetical protein BANRA_00004 [Escherichia coli]